MVPWVLACVFDERYKVTDISVSRVLREISAEWMAENNRGPLDVVRTEEK